MVGKTIDETIRDLDEWMIHFTKWYVSDKDRKDVWEKKAKACEKARDIMCEEFGEPKGTE